MHPNPQMRHAACFIYARSLFQITIQSSRPIGSHPKSNLIMGITQKDARRNHTQSSTSVTSSSSSSVRTML